MQRGHKQGGEGIARGGRKKIGGQESDVREAVADDLQCHADQAVIFGSIRVLYDINNDIRFGDVIVGDGFLKKEEAEYVQERLGDVQARDMIES